ncbi:MAG: exopolysaccharide biosynthesis polyprenyl glycosylphosphotransferase [Sphingomonadales bacterium]|nr:exopolysaccharide biosynthesis polyprenyl glycosylphosphotransferase [Sphingomonadales bacterium]
MVEIKGVILKHVSFSPRPDNLFSAAAQASTLRRLRQRCHVTSAGLDVLAILGGFSLASSLRFGHPMASQAMTWVVALLPIFWIFNAPTYRAGVLQKWRSGIVPTFGSLLSSVLIVLFVSFTLKATDELSRLLLFYGVAASAALMVVLRAAFGRVTSLLFPDTAMTNILVVDSIEVAHPHGMQLLTLDRVPDMQLNDPFVLDQLARRLNGVDSVTVACPPERRTAWALALKGIDVRAQLIVPELDEIGIVGQHHVAGLSTVLISSGPMATRDRLLKRTIDLCIASVALVFFAPLMIVVACAIKLDSNGPALFQQHRVGLGNRLFSMLKFRSMRIETTDLSGNRSASRDDDRITRVGRFIRATSLDELPQLVNVLVGNMSIVGPRPHALGSLAGDELFWEVDVRYHHRHSCKPGLTGLAQVRGFRGATPRRDDLVNRLQADLEYLNGWSMWRDFMIMLSTMKVIVHRNAY